MDLNRAALAIEEFLRALGLEPRTHPELARTGELVAEAFAHDLLSGYGLDPHAILAETMTGARDLVLVRDIAATVICPHHLLPAPGFVHIAYLSGGRIAGLGALARVVDCFSRRLILQETMTRQIAEALVVHLGAEAAGCVADLSPACLTSRGERRHDARVVSLACAGAPHAVARVEAVLVPLTRGSPASDSGGPNTTAAR